VNFGLQIRETIGLEFDYNLIRFLLETSNLDEACAKDSCLHPVTNSIHGEEIEVQTRNTLTWI
jgi:hypothetical protein